MSTAGVDKQSLARVPACCPTARRVVPSKCIVSSETCNWRKSGGGARSRGYFTVELVVEAATRPMPVGRSYVSLSAASQVRSDNNMERIRVAPRSFISDSGAYLVYFPDLAAGAITVTGLDTLFPGYPGTSALQAGATTSPAPSACCVRRPCRSAGRFFTGSAHTPRYCRRPQAARFRAPAGYPSALVRGGRRPRWGWTLLALTGLRLTAAV